MCRWFNGPMMAQCLDPEMARSMVKSSIIDPQMVATE
jgi:hypothetical protein